MKMPAGSRGLTIAASASGTSFTMESLFTPTQWTSATAKKVTVPAGVHLGSSNSSAAITIGTTAWGGDLTLEVAGTISGSGGAAGTAGAGGVGGNAVDANRLGATSQKLIVNILSGGIIRGGGGGGGKGGAGGSGSYTTTEGPYYSQSAPMYQYFNYTPTSNIQINWNGGTAQSGNIYDGVGGSTYTTGGWTYATAVYQGNYRYSVQRSQSTASSGGAGGSGARGQGYDGAAASGSAGAAGGTNAGTGGTGGAGASYGATGTTGSTGAAGNVGAGVAGSSGGLAGYYVANAANAVITNAGTVQGR
jgi:hypothetical protein